MKGRAAAPGPTVRHVLCALGKAGGLGALIEAVAEFAGRDGGGPGTHFEVDRQFSLDQPYAGMTESFAVCWDRVALDDHDATDEAAVAGHGSVLYVLSPAMTAATAVAISAEGLDLAVHLLDRGAVALKGESAGVAHGAARWRALAAAAAVARERGDTAALARATRLAWVKRPLGGKDCYESVGMHLVGLPEVFVPLAVEEAAAVELMDRVADELGWHGVEATLTRHPGAALVAESDYPEADFKHNPFGVVRLT